MAGTIERISIIVPLRDEASHVEHLVDDIAAQTFTGSVELLVADGSSTDGSRELLQARADRAGLALTILDNPAGWVSHGLNACIAQATGDLIVRLDCHTRYPCDYLARLARLSEQTGAWNVGGLVVAEGRSWTERAIACATQSPFGGVHWTRHADDAGVVDVDTVYCGAFRPEAFERAGGFDETLQRNQDDELNLRIRLQGGRIVLDPSLRVRYTPRGSFKALFRQYFEYGYWKVAVMTKHGQVVSARSLVPVVFVGSLGALALLAPVTTKVRPILWAELATYGACAAGFGIAAIRQRREAVELLPGVGLGFLTFHLAYGLGTSWGLTGLRPKSSARHLPATHSRSPGHRSQG